MLAVDVFSLVALPTDTGEAEGSSSSQLHEVYNAHRCFNMVPIDHEVSINGIVREWPGKRNVTSFPEDDFLA